MKNKILITLLLLALIGHAMAAAMTVSVMDSKGAKGEMVKVPINIAGALKLGAMGIVLSYDPAVIKGIGVEGGPLSSNVIVESNEVSPGNMRISIVDSRGVSGDGTIVEVNFEVKGDAGSSSQIDIKTTGYDSNLLDVQMTTKAGRFTVEEPGLPIIQIAVVGIVVLLIVIVAYKKISKKKQ